MGRHDNQIGIEAHAGFDDLLIDRAFHDDVVEIEVARHMLGGECL